MQHSQQVLINIIKFIESEKMDESHTSIIDESNDNDSLEFHQRSLLKNLQMQSPFQVLREKSVEWKVNISSPEFARKLDQEDHLTSFRDQFCIPSKFQLPYGKLTYL